jgi:predicted ATPase
MITRMTVDNFKALRHVEVDLAPFTVLIGPNDTGKTSFLEAVYALAESTRSPLDECFWSPWQNRELVHKCALDTPVRVTATLRTSEEDRDGRDNTDEGLAYLLALTFSDHHQCKVFAEQIGSTIETATELPLGKHTERTTVYMRDLGNVTDNLKGRLESVRQVAEALPPAALARWDVEELAMSSRLDANRKYPFDPSGYGLATCIAEMKLGRGGHFEVLEKDFCARFPAFQEIIVQRATVQGIKRNAHFQKQQISSGEGYALVLLRKDGVEIPAGLASGGTLVTLAFLALTHLPEPRKLLLIEEPENALHPGRLKEIVPLLKEMTGQKGCQVILTTHSPLLLDYVDPAEVRLFLRNAQDDVEVYNVADIPDIRERLK